MSPLLPLVLLLVALTDAAPALCTNAPDATGIVHSLNPYVNVTFADSLTLEGQVASWPFVCNAAFRVTLNGTVRPFIFGDCYLANSDKSLILPLLTYGTYPEDYEASTGYTYRVAFTVHTLLGTDVKSGGVAQASFECVTQDIQGPAAMQLVVANRGPLDSTLSVLFSEPVFLCNGAPSFSSPANISLGLLSGTFSSQLNGIVWSMDVPYGTDSDTLGYPEFATNNLCDAAGNRLATYGGSWPLSPWSIGNEPLVTTNQKDMIVNSVKLYDTDDDGQADILVYPNSLPLVRPSPSIQVINVINQEQVLVGCTNDSWIPTTITCDAPTLFSFSQDYWMRSTENTSAPAAFSPYATLPVDLWAPTDLEPELQVRPVIVSFTSQIGSTEAAVSIAGFIQPTDFLENIYPWLFYDPSATYYLTGYSTFTDETQATVYLGAPLDTTRFGASPVYLSLSPELPFGLFTSQWKPVALSFPSSSQAIQPQYVVLTAGQRLDIWFHNYTGVQLSLDYFLTTNLNFTCPSFHSPLIYNATELRLNVSNCLGLTTNLYLNASKGSIPLGDSFHLQQLVNFPVAYQRYYPIQPLGVYLYDYRVLAIWVDGAEFALQLINTTSLSISCGTLSGIELSTPQVIRANVSGCVEGEETRVIINSYPLAIANDSISALLNLNVSATLLAPATTIAATECFPTFNASLWKVTHADVDESDWEPVGPATVDCSNQTAKVLLKDGDDMFCAMDIEHEGLNCTMTYRILAVQALVYETVTVFNLTSCSYRGPYVEVSQVLNLSQLLLLSHSDCFVFPDGARPRQRHALCPNVHPVGHYSGKS